MNDGGELAERLRRGTAITLLIVGTVPAAFSVLGLCGGLNWILDLFSHFRVQYFVLLLVSGFLLLILGVRRPGGLFLVVAGLNGILIASQFIPIRGKSSKGAGVLRGMLINVNTEAGDPRLVSGAIREASPDFLVLEEINDRWLEDLAWLKGDFPHALTQSRRDNFGIGLWSKHPIVEGRIEFIGVNVPTIRATLQVEGMGLHIVATHPTPPTSKAYARWRDVQLEKLPKVLGSSRPLILMADLNTTPWSSHFRKLLRESQLMDGSRGRGFHPTWPSDNPLLRIPIDHFLHSAEIEVVGWHVGGEVGSDHFPLVVEFQVKGMGERGSENKR